MHWLKEKFVLMQECPLTVFTKYVPYATQLEDEFYDNYLLLRYLIRMFIAFCVGILLSGW